ncbi:branched-chain amino acid ABC transporter permease [Capillibacterium thermochitinicola]|uniref:Branched-chain amino acid ABC transporter permease n=1 Tax=Capillibacterium thermochitinicola TaxID=2699427 RepID=A0A8J6HYP0_9FIRM|nr:branched-chain amino acid ABC transporter permease [Capillibacterium thermochitinicola]MBA2134007.1 branched-chain amino acid ABC transporter permease [Capillibacterium thermochitinicola]
MNAQLLISAIVLGLSMSGVYFLLTVGLSLCYGLMRIISLDQFFYYALGAYMVYTITSITGSFWLGMFVAMLTALVVAFVVERLVNKRVYSKPVMFSMILTFGVNLMGVGLIKYIWGLTPKPVASPIVGRVMILGTGVPTYRIFVIALAVIVYFAVQYFLNKTILGTAIRAGIDDAEKVKALGINISRLFTITFLLSSVLSALAGVIHAPFVMVSPEMGMTITAFAFMVVIIGGLGSIKGTMVSALIVGQVVSLGALIWAPLAEMAPFLVMIIILLIKPTGLYGSKLMHR